MKGAVLAGVLVLTVAGCGGDGGDHRGDGDVPVGAQAVVLPGAEPGIDFDDVVFSPRLNRVVVPARAAGLYLIDPDTAQASRVPVDVNVASADEGDGLFFLAVRGDSKVAVTDSVNPGPVTSTGTASKPDYVRYAAPSGEVLVSEPGASSIEFFSLDKAAGTLRSVASLSVPGGPEGLTISEARKRAYTHAGGDVVAIDLTTRQVAARWATGCAGLHGFPRLDEQRGLLLASCAEDGKVVLLDVEDGQRRGEYSLGAGESLPAFSARGGHFYVRADPGPALAVLASPDLRELARFDVPAEGHCLGADDSGHIWVCDPRGGRMLRYTDPWSGRSSAPTGAPTGG